MSKFILDANLSPETRRYLADTFSLDVIDLITQNLYSLTDNEVVALAKEQGRVIITFDRDFGEIYHFREKGNVGVIVLRLENQTVESVNAVLARFFVGQAETIDLDTTLVMLDEHRVRIIRGED